MLRGFIGCTEDGLDALISLKGRVSCWLHIADERPLDLKLIVSKLLSLGCCHFAISGPCAEAVHDEIDDTLQDRDDLILTTWCTGPIAEAASEFLAVDCPGGGESLRVAVVCSRSSVSSFSTLAEMVRRLGATANNEELP